MAAFMAGDQSIAPLAELYILRSGKAPHSHVRAAAAKTHEGNGTTRKISPEIHDHAHRLHAQYPVALHALYYFPGAADAALRAVRRLGAILLRCLRRVVLFAGVSKDRLASAPRRLLSALARPLLAPRLARLPPAEREA